MSSWCVDVLIEAVAILVKIFLQILTSARSLNFSIPAGRSFVALVSLSVLSAGLTALVQENRLVVCEDGVEAIHKPLACRTLSVCFHAPSFRPVGYPRILDAKLQSIEL